MKIRDAKVSDFAIVVNGQMYFTQELIKIIDEVESLREENVKLNKDRSALQNTNEGLQKQVYNYQNIIENNLTGIRCKELEGEVEQLKQTIKDLEEIIRDVDDFGSELQNQQAVIEFQKKDIECLVKLNAELANEREELKSKQNLLGDYLKDFTALVAVKDSFCGKYANGVSGVIGETLVSVSFADNAGLPDTCLNFVESLINNKTAQ